MVHIQSDVTPADLREILAADLEEKRTAHDTIRTLTKKPGDESTACLMLEETLVEGEARTLARRFK